jgi:hypothetical protein
MSNIATLASLARLHDADLRVVLTSGGIKLSWKTPRKRAECIATPIRDLENIAGAMLERLDVCRDISYDHLIARMTAGQKLRLRTLIAEVRAFQREVLSPTPIEEIEPVLASPRSSLDPKKFVEAGHEVAE